MIGSTVGARYRILRQLGQGGMGAVYVGVHLGTEREVAVKVVREAAQGPEGVQRFLREAKVASKVESQHIVQVFDCGTDDTSGFPYIAMELLSGEDVHQLIRRVGVLAPDLALRIAAQACMGLASAHKAGIIHRDIKPANLFLTRRDGEVVVKILDFGIAKQVAAGDSEEARMTKTGAVLGSPSYMSPEQIRSPGTLDGRTDIWSLGAVIYEMLTGRVPYHQAVTIHALVLAICGERPPHIQDLTPWVPPEVVGVVDTAMQQDRSRRFQTARDMLDFIKRLLPAGSTEIHERALIPLDPRVMTTRAARAQLGGYGAQPAGSPEAPPAYRGSSDVAHAATAVLASATPAVSTAAPAAAAATPPRSLAVPLAATLALVLLGTAGVAAFKLSQGHDEPRPAPLSPPPSLVDASRTVRVRVPEGASVEVDGAAAAPTGGAVDVVGKLGSRHRVRVLLGDRETTAEIVVADEGAVPASVELPAIPTASASTIAPVPVASTTAPVPVAKPIPAAKPARTSTKKVGDAVGNFE